MSEQPKDVHEDGFVIRKLSFEIPSRKKNEDPITDNQRYYLEALSPRIEIEGGLERLGKWQASALIDYVKQERKHLEGDIASSNLRVGGRDLPSSEDSEDSTGNFFKQTVVPLAVLIVLFVAVIIFILYGTAK